MTDGSLMSTKIADIFDKFLYDRQIEIRCADPAEEKDRMHAKVNGNDAALFGMEYWNIVDDIEALISEHDKRNNTIIHNVFQEMLDKTFDYNYEDFESYITTEIGVTTEEIESLRREGLYVKDIDGNDI